MYGFLYVHRAEYLYIIIIPLHVVKLSS